MRENHTAPAASAAKAEAGNPTLFGRPKSQKRILFGQFFSFSGRISRLTFFARAFIVLIAVVAVYVLVLFIIAGYVDRWAYSLQTMYIHYIIVIGCIAALAISTILSFVSFLSLTARRLHDFNRGSKWLFFIIAASLLLRLLAGHIIFCFIWWLFTALVLMLVPGSKGKNRFGYRSLKDMLSEFD